MTAVEISTPLTNTWVSQLNQHLFERAPKPRSMLGGKQIEIPATNLAATAPARGDVSNPLPAPANRAHRANNPRAQLSQP